jgi:glutathione S-transferase
MSSPSRNEEGEVTLHGYPVSNYFNTVRAALIEAGAEFTVVPTRASQDEAFLAVSAMGKIPYLTTEHGGIAETIAILEYIEDAQLGRSLYPAEPFERARARQLINVVQVYVEAPLRSLFPGVFMGGANSAATIAAAKVTVHRAMRAIGTLTSFSPFLMGAQLTHADLFAFYTLDIGERVWRYTYQTSLLNAVPRLRDWHTMMSTRPSTRTVLADFAPAFAIYLRDKAAAWREPEHRETTHA